MANKRVFKFATASAVAASALVAAVPASAASVTYEQASAQVEKARAAANGLHAEYTRNADYKTVVDSKEARDELARAKAKIAALKSAKEKAYLNTRIQGTIDTVERANKYNNAVRVAVTYLPEAKAALEAALVNVDTNVAAAETAKEKYDAYVKQAEINFGKVYGAAIQAKFKSDYLTEAVYNLQKDAAAKIADAKLGPAVKSVSAINATKIEVKFTSAVDKSSVLTAAGAIQGTAIFTLAELDGQANASVTGASLSADGKTLTLTTDVPVSKRYDVVVDGLKTTTGKDVAKYNQVVNFVADATAPTILGTERISASQVKVKFSEPMKAFAPTFQYADGSTVTGVTGSVAAGADEVIFSMDSNVTVNKGLIATFIGAQDQAGNLLTPNPATVSFVKGSADGVAPTVSSITQTGAKTFAVKFSEELLAKPVVEIGGVAVVATDVVQDSTDKTTYNVTAPAVLDGATTVAVKTFSDLSGQSGTDMSKVVTFVKETAAPKVLSGTVVVDDTNKKEYLEITLDKDVVLSTPTVDATSGSFVKDYVTTSLADTDITAKTVAYKSATNKKVLRVELASFLTGHDVKGATYKLNLAFAGVASASGVAADTAQVTFTRGEDGLPASTAVASVTQVLPGVDNNKVEVTFDMAVDGASAINPANYKIDGAIVESVTLKPASGTPTTQVAVLNLKAGSNGFTGTRNINISGVKALGSSKVMNPFFTNSVILKENIAPTVTSAKLTATNELTLTFSEAVTDTTGVDFEVLIGGLSQGTVETVDAGVGAVGKTSVKVTIATIDATELSKGISLKGLSTLDIADAAGNALSLPANISVSQ
ncbi:hypothetical protein [Fictibacillus barbaricus]|uniref:SbsC C-terminal domain-containing protein n=1 Tax=Fictibacillus barbaricus TaxID=182136 RepID=A0ABS2ZH63_9BACL|nr:hypothetical protein [Fictibacillus barbaricus]MBN3546669.1 hypothetical protein [Fictibacillus barbaricus]GGB42839.1 hypothetical protein GCM10007199_05200 [Fictibacillus barbaricus]